ncbi:MAG: long-chain fatty acid--CoA ligase [Desulfomonilaceae bacterium]
MRGINLASYLENSRAAHPDKIALIFDDMKWTFKEIDEKANAIANGLRDMGVEKGERVSLFLPNVPEFFSWYFGVLKAGAIVNPLNVMLKQREIDYIIRDCSPKVIVATKSVAAEPYKIFKNPESGIRKMVVIGENGQGDTVDFDSWIRKFPGNLETTAVAKDDLAAILYTSGTTGQPKGVMLSHENLWTDARYCADWAETTYRDSTVCALPLFHSYALSHVLAELWIEAGTVIWLSRFEPRKCLEAMAKHGATAFHGVATMYYALINEPTVDDYAKQIKLRYCVTGAAVTPEPILRAWNEKFTPLSEGYGTTEASPVVLMNPLPGKGVQKANSCGIPIVPEIEVAAVDEDDQPVEPGEIGELVIRGPNVMKGYWNKPEATMEALKNGWLHTGDMGYFDEDGYCYVKDRKKDMIVTGGFNIYPKEVEDLLYTHPAVAEAQVVGVPELIKGEIAIACITLRDGFKATEQEFIAFCKDNIANYKAPKHVRFFKELPKTVTGKLEKVTLRRMLTEEFEEKSY